MTLKGKWSEIAKVFPGRTDVQLKYRYKKLLRNGKTNCSTLIYNPQRSEHSISISVNPKKKHQFSNISTPKKKVEKPDPRVNKILLELPMITTSKQADFSAENLERNENNNNSSHRTDSSIPLKILVGGNNTKSNATLGNPKKVSVGNIDNKSDANDSFAMDDLEYSLFRKKYLFFLSNENCFNLDDDSMFEEI
jgi:hypothetical protein